MLLLEHLEDFMPGSEEVRSEGKEQAAGIVLMCFSHMCGFY
jgi:hypothetical protein